MKENEKTYLNPYIIPTIIGIVFFFAMQERGTSISGCIFAALIGFGFLYVFITAMNKAK